MTVPAGDPQNALYSLRNIRGNIGSYKNHLGAVEIEKACIATLLQEHTLHEMGIRQMRSTTVRHQRITGFPGSFTAQFRKASNIEKDHSTRKAQYCLLENIP